MPQLKKPEPFGTISSPPPAPAATSRKTARTSMNRVSPAQSEAARSSREGRAKMSAPAKTDSKQSLTLLKMVMSGKQTMPNTKSQEMLKMNRMGPRVSELKKILTTVMRKSAAEEKQQNSSSEQLDQGAPRGVNKARKSFPASSESEKRLGDDSQKKSTGAHQKKHKKRFFRGSTYGLYLSAPKKKKKAKKSPEEGGGGSKEGESDESGDGVSGEELEEASSENGSLASSRVTEASLDASGSREFERGAVEENDEGSLVEEAQKSIADSAEFQIPEMIADEAEVEDAFVVVGSLSRGGRLQSAKKTIHKSERRREVSEDSLADGTLVEVISLEGSSVSEKENSQPEGASDGSSITTRGSLRAQHGSSIASSVKSRQRFKRRLMEDHVDVDEVSLCSSASASPDLLSTAVVPKKPKKVTCNGNGCVPLAQADGNTNGGIIRVDVVYDMRFPIRNKCTCLSKPLDALSVQAAESRMYCQALDSVQGRIVGCVHPVASGSPVLVRPSVRIPFSALCQAHLRRLRLHHCCPGCGVFCTQGEFVQCGTSARLEVGTPHLFHRRCQVDGGNGGISAPLCPHCGSDAPFEPIHLELRTPRPPTFYLTQHLALPSKRNARMTSRRGEEGIEEKPAIAGESYTIEDLGITVSTDLLPQCSARKELELMLRKLKTEKVLGSKHNTRSMYSAAKSGDLESVLHMILSGHDVNHMFSEHNGSTALHTASGAGHLAIVHVLFQAGAFLDERDSQLYTPVMRAVDSKAIAVVNYLIKAGADIRNKRGEDGMTCLHLAARSGSVEMCNLLLNSEALPINVQDDGGWTPLVWASEHGKAEVVRFLLSRGADPNLKDGEENIALHWSAFSGNVDISAMYLDRGCDVNAVNEHGDTPLHVAARQGNHDVAVVLLNRGACLDVVNKRNESPIGACKDEKSLSWLVLNVNMELRKAIKDNSIVRKTTLHRDISRGKELNPIDCVNEVDDEPVPTDFLYLLENCETVPISIDRTITSLQSCKCDDLCTSPSCLCSSISYRCWYSKEGRLVPEFNILDPPMLFECSRACLCWNTCQNRVVQNGITCHLQLFRTSGKGWGVRTLQSIPKGTFVCEYIGEILSDSEADQREDDSYLFDLENRDGETFCLDARYYGNVSRFVNHLCEPNLVPVRVFVDHQDLSFPRMAFFSSRDIDAYEELGFDYGEKFWMIKYKMFTCECGSDKCKYSKDRIQETLINYNKRLKEDQAANASYMATSTS